MMSEAADDRSAVRFRDEGPRGLPADRSRHPADAAGALRAPEPGVRGRCPRQVGVRPDRPARSSCGGAQQAPLARRPRTGPGASSRPRRATTDWPSATLRSSRASASSSSCRRPSPRSRGRGSKPWASMSRSGARAATRPRPWPANSPAATGRVFVSPYNDPDIVRGAGTIGSRDRRRPGPLRRRPRAHRWGRAHRRHRRLPQGRPARRPDRRRRARHFGLHGRLDRRGPARRDRREAERRRRRRRRHRARVHHLPLCRDSCRRDRGRPRSLRRPGPGPGPRAPRPGDRGGRRACPSPPCSTRRRSGPAAPSWPS
ncbi:MAG: hypothetical protein M0C28_35695 [Candidatus Moduliflexus flocculans]|nr:hypothetical protein [Candidatus Moduliflexus flocculans]